MAGRCLRRGGAHRCCRCVDLTAEKGMNGRWGFWRPCFPSSCSELVRRVRDVQPIRPHQPVLPTLSISRCSGPLLPLPLPQLRPPNPIPGSAKQMVSGSPAIAAACLGNKRHVVSGDQVTEVLTELNELRRFRPHEACPLGYESCPWMLFFN